MLGTHVLFFSFFFFQTGAAKIPKDTTGHQQKWHRAGGCPAQRVGRDGDLPEPADPGARERNETAAARAGAGHERAGPHAAGKLRNRPGQVRGGGGTGPAQGRAQGHEVQGNANAQRLQRAGGGEHLAAEAGVQLAELAGKEGVWRRGSLGKGLFLEVGFEKQNLVKVVIISIEQICFYLKLKIL